MKVRIAKNLNSKFYHLEEPDKSEWPDHTTLCGRYMRTSIFIETAAKQNLILCRICSWKSRAIVPTK